MKTIIGLAGETGSGKNVFCEYVKNNYENVFYIRFSQPLTEALGIFFEEIRKEDQQWLGTALRERYGNDIIGKAVMRRINNIKEGIKVDWMKILVVFIILVGAIMTNFAFDFPALGVWIAILLGALVTKTP